MREELASQFRECILSVATLLQAGYSVENAFLECRQDMALMYGEESIKIIQGKLKHNKKRFPIPGAFPQHVFGDLIPLIC